MRAVPPPAPCPLDRTADWLDGNSVPLSGDTGIYEHKPGRNSNVKTMFLPWFHPVIIILNENSLKVMLEHYSCTINSCTCGPNAKASVAHADVFPWAQVVVLS